MQKQLDSGVVLQCHTEERVQVVSSDGRQVETLDYTQYTATIIILMYVSVKSIIRDASFRGWAAVRFQSDTVLSTPDGTKIARRKNGKWSNENCRPEKRRIIEEQDSIAIAQ